MLRKVVATLLVIGALTVIVASAAGVRGDGGRVALIKLPVHVTVPPTPTPQHCDEERRSEDNKPKIDEKCGEPKLCDKDLARVSKPREPRDRCEDADSRAIVLTGSRLATNSIAQGLPPADATPASNQPEPHTATPTPKPTETPTRTPTPSPTPGQGVRSERKVDGGIGGDPTRSTSPPNTPSPTTTPAKTDTPQRQ